MLLMCVTLPIAVAIACIIYMGLAFVLLWGASMFVSIDITMLKVAGVAAILFVISAITSQGVRYVKQ